MDSMEQQALGGGGGQACSGAQSDSSGSGDQMLVLDHDKSKLIVNYIPQFATEGDLAEIFAPVGQVEDIKIMRDYKTGYSFGFGFVKYFHEDDAAKAIHLLNGMNYKNKRLKVSYSRPPGTNMKDSNLYITNLPRDITEQDVENIFCGYGEIVQKSLLKDKITGMPRGVAFVRFSKSEEAQAAIAGLDGKLLDNAMEPLRVRVAEDHGRQKAQYLDHWNVPPMYNRGFPPVRKMGMPPPPPLDPFQGRNRAYQHQQHHPSHHQQHNHNNGPPRHNLGAGDNYYTLQNPFLMLKTP